MLGHSHIRALGRSRRQALVYSGLESAYKVSGYGPKFRVGHFEGKERVSGKPNHHLLMRSHSKHIPGSYGSLVAWTVIDSRPYIETMSEVFAPNTIEDNGFGFSLPLGTGAMPMIYLENLARYAHLALSNPRPIQMVSASA